MPNTPPADADFESLLSYIQEARGLDFRGYKRTSLRRRITLRMEALGLDSFASYRGQLEAQPSEFEDLLNTVLINVTSFFRDPDAWDVLKHQVVPALIAGGDGDRPIRVWSVGCASGEEPYSIAMLLADAMGIEDFCRRVKIYATDLDDDALKIARAATYTPRDVDSVPAAFLDKFFDRTNNHYVFERELRKCVIFGRHNVVADAPISRIDLLACRNLLIYLETETQNIVLPRLHYALKRDAFLFLGKAETQLARSSLFRPVDMKHRVFAKVPQEWRRSLNGGFAHTRGNFDPASSDPGLLDTIVEGISIPLLAVDDQGIVTLANSAGRNLLGVDGSDIGRPFQDLPVSYRPIELRGPIDEVFRTRRGVRLENQEYRLNHDDALRLTIELRPLLRPDSSIHAVLLAFVDNTRVHHLQRELEAAQENLEHSIEELQSANEELETTNEELQSTNEELETTNEELQSTNEELETLNEEARSSNEEMESVNEELRLQAEQAASYRLYLESILRAMNGGIIVVDTNQIIRSWNRWSENTWGMRSEEVVGTPFDKLDTGLPVAKLRDVLGDVQRTRHDSMEQQIEGVDRRGRRILMRVRLTALLDDSEVSHGAVMLFQDITDEHTQEEYARYLGRIMGRALNGIYFLEPTSLRFVLANAGARERLGYDEGQLKQMSLPDIIQGVPAADVHALIAPLLTGAENEIVFEATLRTSTGGDFPVEICLQYMREEQPPILVAIVQPTAQRRALHPAENG